MPTVLALALFVIVATIVKLGVRRVFRGPAPQGRDAPTPDRRRRR